MTKLSLNTLICFFLALSTTSAFAPPGTIGNGGDLRILMFKKARNEAVNILGKLIIYRSHLAKSLKLQAPLKDFFLEEEGALEKLAADVLDSPHMYDLKEQKTCAWTNDPDPSVEPQGLNTIRLSLPVCGPYLFEHGQSRAVHILIHESVHHLLRDKAFREAHGIKFTGSKAEQYEQEEALCDAVADKVAEAFDIVAEAGAPHWLDVSMKHNLEDRGFHSSVWTGATGNPLTENRMIVWGGCRENENSIYGCSKYFSDGAIYDPLSDFNGNILETTQWEALPLKDAPEGRAEQGTAFSSFAEDSDQLHKMFIWGGCTEGDGCVKYLNSGSIFDITSRTWEKVAKDAFTPSPRSNHSVVWSGSEFLVWGGSYGAHTPGVTSQALADGGAYNPSTRKWRTIPSSMKQVGLEARSFHSAIWTGDTGNPDTAHKMLVWGGCDIEEFLYCDKHYNDGALYDPNTQKWQKLETQGPAPSPRRLHGGIHIATHNVFLVWGGQRGSRNLNDGAYLDLRTLSWHTMKQSALEPRSRHTMVWTGDHVLVFGGEIKNDAYATNMGAFKFPSTATGPGRWDLIQRELIPYQVVNHTALWTPFGMLVWGGQTDRRAFANIGAFFREGDLGWR